MKPLTINELKALPIGDWVWVVIYDGDKQCEEYWQKEYTPNERVFCCRKGVLPYEWYGRRWKAWRNKEQAEAKGEIVELPCKVGDSVWYVTEDSIETYVVDRIGCDSNGWYFCGDDEDRYEHYFNDETEISVTVFFSKDEAEKRLAELKGEK